MSSGADKMPVAEELAPVLVLAAPSGTGKTTVARELVGCEPDRFRFSVSATTRAPRGEERDGVDYHFVDTEVFERMITEGALLEWAVVHGRRYGTPWAEVSRPSLPGGADPITVLDIDVQGALQVRDRVESAILVFLLPPNGAVLVDRLRGRGTDDTAEIERRMAGALDELDEAEKFDFVLVNDQLEETVATVKAIARAHGVRVTDPQAVRRQTKNLKAEIREAAGTAV